MSQPRGGSSSVELPPMHDDAAEARSIFGQAYEIESTAERLAFLDEICAGRPELRARVDGLLRSLQDARDFMETPVVEPLLGVTGPFVETSDHDGTTPALPRTTDFTTPAQDGEAEEKVGSWIGPYLLVKELGEGGMGAVFLAEEKGALRRTVALKIVKSGMDVERFLVRFQAEQQALTLMDHPNIARLFTAGLTDRGRPYFVMEYVDGKPLSQVCDEWKLTLRERLQVFVKICDALEHAHARKVIHRDLKPGNVLVVERNGQLEPKVIDFGLAKALEEPLTDESQLTQYGTLLGTPEYMSPEQADFHLPELDAQSDVYALGVILYELLTGTTPLDMAGRPKENVLETLRRIREEDAPWPSRRVASLGARQKKIAARRGVEPAGLVRLLRGELDCIALKSLAKEKERRYRSAEGLALDVGRYLRDERVEARPPSLGYRLGKFVRRNRIALVTASAFALVLLIALASWLVNQARLAGQTQRAEKAEDMKIESVLTAQESILKRLREGQSLAEDEKITFRNVAQNLEEFLADPGSSWKAREASARVRMCLGGMLMALGNKDDARTQYERAVTQFEELAADPEHGQAVRATVATCLRDQAYMCQKYASAETEALYLRAIDMRKRLLQVDRNNTALQRELVEDLNNLAILYRDQGKLEVGWHLAREAVALADRLPGDNLDDRKAQAVSSHTLGNILRDQNKLADASEAYFRAAGRLTRLVSLPPDVKEVLRNIYWDGAYAQALQGQHRKASDVWRATIAQAQGPTVEQLRLFLAASEAEEKLSKTSAPQGSYLVEAALAQARAAAAAQQEKEQAQADYYSRRALELLKQAARTGYFDKGENRRKLLDDPAIHGLPASAVREAIGGARAGGRD
ncbi:MAG: serine/threonine-protein kinase [Gemmataceae bacterium]